MMRVSLPLTTRPLRAARMVVVAGLATVGIASCGVDSSGLGLDAVLAPRRLDRETPRRRARGCSGNPGGRGRAGRGGAAGTGVGGLQAAAPVATRARAARFRGRGGRCRRRGRRRLRWRAGPERRGGLGRGRRRRRRATGGSRHGSRGQQRHRREPRAAGARAARAARAPAARGTDGRRRNRGCGRDGGQRRRGHGWPRRHGRNHGGRGGTGGVVTPCTALSCSDGCCKDSTTCIRMRSATQCGAQGSRLRALWGLPDLLGDGPVPDRSGVALEDRRRLRADRQQLSRPGERGDRRHRARSVLRIREPGRSGHNLDRGRDGHADRHLQAGLESGDHAAGRSPWRRRR